MHRVGIFLYLQVLETQPDLRYKSYESTNMKGAAYHLKDELQNLNADCVKYIWTF